MRIWSVDSWDNENIFIAADGVTVGDSGDLEHNSCPSDWTEWASGTSDQPASYYGCWMNACLRCGPSSIHTCYIDVELVLAHTADTLAVSVTDGALGATERRTGAEVEPNNSVDGGF